MVGFNFLRGSLCFVINMVLKFLLWMVIMCHMKNQQGMLVPETNDNHFRREVYIGVIDQISQELDNRFDEVNMELLSCMSAFNPSNSFASFAQKVRRLAEFYPNDIPG